MQIYFIVFAQIVPLLGQKSNIFCEKSGFGQNSRNRPLILNPETIFEAFCSLTVNKIINRLI